ncbi:OmpP1/FadL family transporter [Thioalkalivibrio sulfidiphilus]|uniref:OmpP1/FadL family transporter n=1 Tax=Thioalkalivibrio sulfidiphilus TaxID=1033854 RepID=UPI00037B72FC|nr:outer membrane protein transport protein [Thioalkalivibrio sulfidiphilus]
MRKVVRQSTVLFAVAAGLGVAGVANATNGYFSHGYGTTSKGLAGAGVALSQDSLAAATNPAGMVNVGDRIDLGAALFSPHRKYTTTGGPSEFCDGPNCSFSIGPQSISSDNNYFLVPHFGWNKMLDDRSSIGISIYGNGGMNTEYKGGNATFFFPASMGGPDAFVSPEGTYGGGTAGVDLMQLFIAPTYARKFNDTASWGVTPIIAYQRFKATGLGTFAPNSSDFTNLSDRGYDSSWGFGVRLGVQGEVAPGVRLGASYQSKIFAEEFDKYKGLFAEQGDFDIPANMTVGLAWDVSPTSTLLFDIQHIWYSDVKSIANPLMPNLMQAQLGDDGGAGFGWKDMTIAKIGYQWQTSPDMTWRLGYSYGKQPIRDSEVLFNILAPAVIEHHLTAGFTRQMGPNNELNFAAMYAPTKKVSGPNPLDPAQTIEIEMYQFDLELSYAWKF